ncbi:hypothetical protein EB061_12020 [bacterium]|nr:hypothetical protein [bacterium]
MPFFGFATDYFSAYREQSDGGACKAWLALQIKEGDSVLSLEDYGLYLLHTRNVRVAVLDKELDDLVRAETSPERLVGELRKKGFRYLYQLYPLDTKPFLPNASAITQWLRQQKGQLVLDRGDCLVLDFARNP